MGQQEAGSSAARVESLEGNSFSLKINMANEEAKYLIRLKYIYSAFWSSPPAFQVGN